MLGSIYFQPCHFLHVYWNVSHTSTGYSPAEMIFEYMSIILQGCKGVVYYIDNILVTGQTQKEHEENLWEVFQHLQYFGLKIKLEKYQFLRSPSTIWGIQYPVKH